MSAPGGRDYLVCDENPETVGTFAYALQDAATVTGISPFRAAKQAGDRNGAKWIRYAYGGRLIPNAEKIEELAQYLNVRFIFISGVGWDWCNRLEDDEPDTDTESEPGTEERTEAGAKGIR